MVIIIIIIIIIIILIIVTILELVRWRMSRNIPHVASQKNGCEGD